MALESANYIQGLVASNPAQGDLVAQADDHLRLIKQVLLNTFPNFTGAVTKTALDLSTGIVPGCVIMWAGSAAQIPFGWAPCDGNTYTSPFSNLPVTTINLMGRVPVMAGASGVTAGSTGGYALNTPRTLVSSTDPGHVHTGTTDQGGSHNHSGSSGATAITGDQLPSHSHNVGLQLGQTGAIFAAGTALSAATFQNAIGYNAASNSAGSGNPHAHTISPDGIHGHTFTSANGGAHSHTTTADLTPAYFGLYFLQRL